MSYDYLQIINIIYEAPNLYASWWINLYREAPHHVWIETSLFLFIIWLLLIRKTVDPSKVSKQVKLSKSEENWLIETWVPEPLVPSHDIEIKTPVT